MRRRPRQNPKKQFLILAAAAGIGAAFLFARKPDRTPSGAGAAGAASLVGAGGLPGPLGVEPASAAPVGASVMPVFRKGETPASLA